MRPARLHVPLVLALFLAACHGKIDLDDDASVDADGDGSAAGEDCDDTDPEVHPGAAEVCGGPDEDCDGLTDDDDPGVTNTAIWYVDGDDDGFGDDDQARTACARPPGTAESSGDCADDDVDVSPDATERCDGVDDDCDAAVDADDPDVDPSEAVWYADADADGHGDPALSVTTCTEPAGYVHAGDDCDDDAPSVFPGAAEVCDDADDDCDDLIDEDDPDLLVPTRYADADGDGWGDDGAAVTDCDAPAGSVDVGGDCDDADADVRPDASETCGPGDEDCDGLAEDEDPDVVDPADWYADVDGDGWGDAGAVVSACDPGAGWSATAGDCDDAAAAAFPGSAEVWYDGIDGDCDGASDYDADGDGHDALAFGGGDCDDADATTSPDAPEAMGNGADDDCDGLIDGIGLASADVVIRGAAGEYAGGVVTTGDFDGDGADDVMLSAYGSTAAGPAAGAVFVHRGPLASGATTASASLAIYGTDGAYAGVRVATAGDIDGDGADDLVIGSFYLDSYRGGGWTLSGLGSGLAWVDDAGGSFTGASAGDYAGYSVAGAGDVDGDGLDDVLIGAYNVMPGACCAYTGAAYLLRGPATGATGLASADAILAGESNGDHAGEIVTGLGDIDGDGLADVAVAAVYHGSGYRGAVYVESGPFSGSRALRDAPLVITGATDGIYLGTALGDVGDVDGDGLDDIAIGANGASGGAGSVYLLTGAPTGSVTTASAAASFDGAAGDYLGSQGGIAGADWNGDGDGDGDLLFGAATNGEAGSNAGIAYLYLGPVSGALGPGDAYARLFGEAPGDYLGSALSPLGDQDGDGLPEILLGAGSSDVGGTDAGAAYIVYSSRLF